jgi:hypothetical protein
MDCVTKVAKSPPPLLNIATTPQPHLSFLRGPLIRTPIPPLSIPDSFDIVNMTEQRLLQVVDAGKLVIELLEKPLDWHPLIAVCACI